MGGINCRYYGKILVKGDKTFHEEYFGNKNIYYSRELLNISLSQVDTSSHEGKVSRELLINYQEEFI